ncbi:MAG: UDP-2,3-diacylglucosamine diphosphatase [Acidobacteriota bacterium]
MGMSVESRTRTIILGDVHLGSPICRARQLYEVLDKAPFDRLVLNGDIFDDLNFRRLRDKHWDVLEKIRERGRQSEIVWIRGNHDGAADVLRHLLGVPVLSDFTFSYHDEKVWVIHGDQFDDFQESAKKWRNLRDVFYGFAIWFDAPRKTAIKWAQRSTRAFARAASKVKRKAVERGRARGAKWVVVGHTHHREEAEVDGIGFFNPSSWLTSNPAYVLFDEAEEKPRLVVMGLGTPKSLRRAARTQAKRVRRSIRRRLAGRER